MPNPINIPSPNVPEPQIFNVTAFDLDSLQNNLDNLFESMWKALLKVRLESMDYTLQGNGPNFTVQYVPSSDNPAESDSLSKLYYLCKQEAHIISKMIYEYIKAAEKPLRVKVPHAKDADTIPLIKEAHVALDTTYFDIEAGNNNATPKGLNI